ncbi:MAG: hypothetical protein ACRDR6_17645 [Pseudonocardiaceae bacterium]
MNTMQHRRRYALEAMGRAAARPPSPDSAHLRLDEHTDPTRPDPRDLVDAVTRRLLRDLDDATDGPGYTVLSGLSGSFVDVDEARLFHRHLFDQVWSLFRKQPKLIPDGPFRTASRTVADGRIPIDQYGSAWSFKELHADRDALLFSHLYGPAQGFDGGELLIADARRFLAGRSLAFDEVFSWSQEPTAGSKPVLRRRYHEAVMTECGAVFKLGCTDIVVLVNNLPEAGVLHGARPVRVTDPDRFVREYHRCSARQADPDREPART